MDSNFAEISGMLLRPELLAAAGAVALGVGGLLIWHAAARRRDRRLLNRALRRHADAVVEDLAVPDGMDGLLFIDRFVRCGGRLVAMKLVEREGHIFGADGLEEWTSIHQMTTRKFPNPVAALTQAVRLIRHATGFEDVEAWAVFGRAADFPKGRPQGVVLIDELASRLAELKAQASSETAAQAAFEKAKSLAEGSDETPASST